MVFDLIIDLYVVEADLNVVVFFKCSFRRINCALLKFLYYLYDHCLCQQTESC